MSQEERWDNITNAYYNFLTDNKKWVRAHWHQLAPLTATNCSLHSPPPQVTSSAYQNLGAYIATFANPSKSHCELSPEGHINNLLANCQLPPKSSTPTKEPPPSVPNNNNISSSEDSDNGNYNSFLYWKPPVAPVQTATVSSVCLSLKDIDLNSSDQSSKSECPTPDLAEYNQVSFWHWRLRGGGCGDYGVRVWGQGGREEGRESEMSVCVLSHTITAIIGASFFLWSAIDYRLMPWLWTIWMRLCVRVW